LDKLAEEAKLLEGSAIHKRLLDLSLTKEDVGFSILVSEELRRIGFYSYPENATEFLKTIIEDAEGLENRPQEDV
jgi:hypothetical protein